MKEIAWAGLVDRSGWARGSWDRELADKVQWTDKGTGLACLAIRRHDGVWCGYVGVAQGHPAFQVPWRQLSGLRVHRGVDYAGFCSGHICHLTELGEAHQVWWLGFATTLSRDLSPGEDTTRYYRPYNPSGPRQYRSLGYVRGHCAKLAEQLARIAAGRHVPWKS
jgi:hypothetical protein